MTQEQEAEVQRLIKDVDVTELMGMLMKHGNRYSRRILKFSGGSASTFQLRLWASTHTAFMISRSILEIC